jgi:hypothetical protein
MTLLRNRGKALEEAFFTRHNQRLMRSLQRVDDLESRAVALAEVSGIRNESLIHECLDLDIHAETFAALMLVPMIAVAWSDGEVSIEERSAILRVAERNGILKKSPAHDLLDGWLKHKPAADLMTAWKKYVREVVSSLTKSSREALVRQVLKDSEQVAEVAGGFWGLGNPVSPAEEAVLSSIRQALD